jgi:hypothetical protein
MEVILSPKIDKKYNCNICHYNTSSKKDYEKHNLTSKHKKNEHGSILEVMEVKKIPNFVCECSKKFITHSGLWKHKQRCNTDFQIEEFKNNYSGEDEREVKTLTNLVLEVVKQNQEVVKQNQELINQNNETQKYNQDLTNKIIELSKNCITNTNITNSNNNSHNKSFNLNFFLNETCKDAMNIMDFVDSIKLQLSDLENVGKIGYVEGISNIIVKNLKELDITQRPVHCADKKREVMYVKDDDKWAKEDETKKKIKKAIKRVVFKNQRLIPQFKEKHPDCLKSVSKFSDQYNKIIVESMGGSGDNDDEKEDKIIRNISKNVIIDKE